MVVVTEIVGSIADKHIAERLCHLGHEGGVEVLSMADTLRRRWRGKTDRGTDVVIAVNAGVQLEDGAVLLLEPTRAIVLRTSAQRWVRVRTRDVDAAAEVGYCIGNQHWRVRFEPGEIQIAVEGMTADYLAKLDAIRHRSALEIIQMSSFAAKMAVLQYGDSFFPSGSACFSWGMEFLSENTILTSADDVKSFVRGQLYARWAKFDRPVVTAAHRANLELGAVSAIDNQVDIQTASAEFRTGSRRLGRAMLAIFAKLGRDEATAYQNMVSSGSACGHLAPMQGFLWAAAGLNEEDAVALSLHTFCVGLLSAAIRLGCLSHIEAQVTLEDLRHEAERIAQTAVCGLDEISSCAFEFEIAVMRHAKQATRMFSN